MSFRLFSSTHIIFRENLLRTDKVSFKFTNGKFIVLWTERLWYIAFNSKQQTMSVLRYAFWPNYDGLLCYVDCIFNEMNLYLRSQFAAFNEKWVGVGQVVRALPPKRRADKHRKFFFIQKKIFHEENPKIRWKSFIWILRKF